MDFDKLTIEDLQSEDMRMVAEQCGIEIAITLMKEMGGLTVNIPKNGFRLFQKNYILKNRSQSAKKLALITGVPIRTVYEILEEK